MINLLYHIFNALFPERCFGCQTVNQSPFCDNCLSKISINRTLFCAECRARLPDNKKICHKNSEYILGAATAYEELIKNLIWQLKYRKKTAAAKPLGEILNQYLERINLSLKNFSLIAIPLHSTKERQRGFNQSFLIAEKAAEKFGVALLQNCLIKIKNTPPQMKIKDWQKRSENIQNSFQIEKPENIRGKNIILIDDVVTSGSTFNEAVRILKLNGAKKIIAIAIAKAG